MGSVVEVVPLSLGHHLTDIPAGKPEAVSAVSSLSGNQRAGMPDI